MTNKSPEDEQVKMNLEENILGSKSHSNLKDVHKSLRTLKTLKYLAYLPFLKMQCIAILTIIAKIIQINSQV